MKKLIYRSKPVEVINRKKGDNCNDCIFDKDCANGHKHYAVNFEEKNKLEWCTIAKTKYLYIRNS